jgi:hypothetical protein
MKRTPINRAPAGRLFGGTSPRGLHRLLRRIVGRIYENRGGPDDLRWFWSMTVNGPMTRSNRVATVEEAKAQFQQSWGTPGADALPSCLPAAHRAVP